MSEDPRDIKYYIVCKERSWEGVICWWRPNGHGYTTVLSEAGVYSEQQSAQIVLDSHDGDFRIDQMKVLNLKTRTQVYLSDNLGVFNEVTRGGGA